MSSSHIPVIVVSGFLGAGKTSFVRNLLLKCGKMNLKPALIINEVGEVDVDGELLADAHAESIKIVGGCICCTLQSQLSLTMSELLEKENCDIIIIECSGLSNPMDVVSALSSPYLLQSIIVNHIICLLDVTKTEKLFSGIDLVESQAIASNIIILNKTDLVDESVLESQVSFIRNKFPNSKFYMSRFGSIADSEIERILSSDEIAHYCSECCEHHNHKHEHAHNHSHSLPASFCTVAIALPIEIERARLDSIINLLPENVVRAKGFANVNGEGWQVIQKSFDNFNTTPFGDTAPKAGAILICIGVHLNAEEIAGIVN